MAIDNSDPERLFRHYILKNLESALSSVKASKDAGLSDEIRERALHSLDYGLEVAEAWPLVRKLLLRIAPKMEQAGYRNKWIEYLEIGTRQSRSLQDVSTEGKLCFHAGYLCRLKGDLPRAQDKFSVSLHCSKETIDIKGQAAVHNQYGYIARLQDRYDEARNYVERALNLSVLDDPERAFSYFVLGTVAQAEGDCVSAENYHRISLNIYTALHDDRRIAWSLQNLGIALYGQCNYAEARACYEQAIKILTLVQDPINLSIVKMNLGIVYYSQEQWDQALTLYKSAEPIFRRSYDQLRLAQIYTNMALVYRSLEKWDEAENFCLSSIELWQKMNRTKSQLNTMDELGLVYLGQKQVQKAVETFEKAISILSQIGYDPSYARIRKLLTVHLTEAEDASANL
ncbi:tetratricopeptide repeat protein [Chloroflexi bacterium TSY]|nr:tetratricopeptide repeat protein [Chloroflexi bacterium TSY]